MAGRWGAWLLQSGRLLLLLLPLQLVLQTMVEFFSGICQEKPMYAVELDLFGKMGLVRMIDPVEVNLELLASGKKPGRKAVIKQGLTRTLAKMPVYQEDLIPEQHNAVLPLLGAL